MPKTAGRAEWPRLHVLFVLTHIYLWWSFIYKLGTVGDQQQQTTKQNSYCSKWRWDYLKTGIMIDSTVSSLATQVTEELTGRWIVQHGSAEWTDESSGRDGSRWYTISSRYSEGHVTENLQIPLSVEFSVYYFWIRLTKDNWNLQNWNCR